MISSDANKPGGAPKAQFTENNGYRWYSQKQIRQVEGSCFPLELKLVVNQDIINHIFND